MFGGGTRPGLVAWNEDFDAPLSYGGEFAIILS